MDVLIGQYSQTLTEKNRLVIPAKWRQNWHRDLSVFVASHQPNFLELYPQEKWLQLQEAVESLPRFNTSVREFKRLFYSQVDEQQLDTQGRVILTETMLANLNNPSVGNKLRMIGASELIEIWPEDSWEVKLSRQKADLPTLMDRVAMLQ
jgi:division/cell wall cluster transcriptional repressor MraZ